MNIVLTDFPGALIYKDILSFYRPFGLETIQSKTPFYHEMRSSHLLYSYSLGHGKNHI